MSMLKAVHSPRRAVDFVRISFEKLTTPRLKWLAALVKFQDGKEFEPKGNAFQVKGALSNAATLASLDRRPQCVSVFMSGSPRLGDVRSMTSRKCMTLRTELRIHPVRVVAEHELSFSSEPFAEHRLRPSSRRRNSTESTCDAR